MNIRRMRASVTIAQHQQRAHRRRLPRVPSQACPQHTRRRNTHRQPADAGAPRNPVLTAPMLQLNYTHVQQLPHAAQSQEQAHWLVRAPT
jgi:hypothetical protein